MNKEQKLPFKVDSIAVIGLGYVGLPLAIALMKYAKNELLIKLLRR